MLLLMAALSMVYKHSLLFLIVTLFGAGLAYAQVSIDARAALRSGRSAHHGREDDALRLPKSGDPNPGRHERRGRGTPVAGDEAAQFMNMIQELAESTRLGIPVMFKSNARNHYERDARSGINVSAGALSKWPKEAGLAATRDMELIAAFAQTMRREWTAIGLRGMYGYMADLATEPCWYRVHETFTEDADLAADIMSVLVENLQGDALGSGSVTLTMKHFPGGRPARGRHRSALRIRGESGLPHRQF